MLPLLLALLLTLGLATPALAVETSFASLYFGWGGGNGIVYQGHGGPLMNGGGLDADFGVDFFPNMLYFETGPILEAPATPSPATPDGFWVTDIPDVTYRWDGGGRFVIESHPLCCGGVTTSLFAGAVTGASLVVTEYDPEYASWEGTFVLELQIEEAGSPAWLGAATLTMPIHPTSYLLFTGGAGELLALPQQATLTLVPTPEPGTWVLVGSGLVALALRQIRPKRSRIRRTTSTRPTTELGP